MAVEDAYALLAYALLLVESSPLLAAASAAVNAQESALRSDRWVCWIR
jgi:hypothetical protein